MMEVNIYIASSIKGNKLKQGYIGFVLQAGSTDATKTVFEECDANSNHSVVICLEKALARIKPSCNQIIIHTNLKYVDVMLSKPRKNQGTDLLKTSKGQDIQYAAEWASIYEKLKGKDVKVKCNQPNEFRSWLQQECERRAEKHGS